MSLCVSLAVVDQEGVLGVAVSQEVERLILQTHEHQSELNIIFA